MTIDDEATKVFTFTTLADLVKDMAKMIAKVRNLEQEIGSLQASLDYQRGRSAALEDRIRLLESAAGYNP